MKIYKIEMIVADIHGVYPLADITSAIENSVECVVHFTSVETKDDKKEWSHNSPLNHGARRAKNYYEKLP